MKKQTGFSLIEILVATSIIITTTTIVIAILVSSFRASSKTTALDIVRQNGNNAINKVSRMIQYSESFEGVSNSVDGPYTKICPTLESGEDNEFSYLKIRMSSENIVKFACTGEGLFVDSNDGVIDDEESLIDSNRVTVFSDSCRFTCTKGENASPVIGLTFDLVYGADPNPTMSFTEKRAMIHFSTSVKMRNK